MESTDKLTQWWSRERERTSTFPELKGERIRQFIAARIRRERQVIFQYFWANLVWQIVVYASACHFMARFWGDWLMLLLSLAYGLVFIPFTVTFMKKFKAVALSNAVTRDVLANVRYQREKLASFFRFKRFFDYLATPLIALVIVAIIFKLYLPGGILAHVTGAWITYVIVLVLFSIANYFENRKRFVMRLRNLEEIIAEMREEHEAS